MGIVQFLVEQSGNPSGFVGKILLRAMDLSHGKVITKALEPLEKKHSVKVLDIGCGSGYALQVMNRQFRHSRLYGIDISETCVQTARKNNRKALHNNSFEVQLGDVTALLYEATSMDLVTAFQTHYFWPDLQLACREIQRVLKSNGLFVLCGDLYKMKYHLEKYQFPSEYPTLLKEVGFSVVEIIPFNGFMIAYAKKCA